MNQTDHDRVKDAMATLSPHVLSVLAARDNSAAIRKHARDALIVQVADRYDIKIREGEVVRV